MPPLSFLRLVTVLAFLLHFCTSLHNVAAKSSYYLNTEYYGQDFFDGFDFFTGVDPTNGFVDYVNRSIAEVENLISYGSGAPAVMRASSSEYLIVGQTQGRASIRIESKKTFTHGLIITDIAHMPGDDCGIWPAYWTLGPNWPNNGEIDIIEGVNSGSGQQMKNLMSLHTSPGCTIAGSNELGQIQTNNCDTTINYSSGCGILAQNISSYGSAFNMVNGGVYATEWTSDYIRIWFFPRDWIPADISAGSPDPSEWGLPQANFQGSCTIDDKFRDHKIIFDITFCGDYAGSVFSSDTVCKGFARTCEDYVARNPHAFDDAFWSINYIQVYNQVAPSASTAPSSSSSATQVYGQVASSVSRVSSPTSATSLSPQNLVSAPGMGFNNSTWTSFRANPTESLTGVGKIQFGTWNYLVCASSISGFSTFVEAGDSAYTTNMTVEICTSLCSAKSSIYAGLYGWQCYCAASIGSDLIITNGSLCSIPCPGNASELCGGQNSANGKVDSRQIQNAFLLSVYVNTVFTPFRSTTTLTNVATALTSAMPQNLVYGYGMGGGATSVTTTIVSISYIDICSICLGGFTTITTSQIIQYCNCMNVPSFPFTPSIVMTATVKLCAVCGERGLGANVTVTVPYSYYPSTRILSGISLGVSATEKYPQSNFSGNIVKVSTTAVEARVESTAAPTATKDISSPFTGDAAIVCAGMSALIMIIVLVLISII